MRFPALLAAALAASAIAAVPAAAAPASGPAAVKMKCPIGGATFSFTPLPPPPALGLRPDGKPYGPGLSPPPLPECPDNGLVLYKEYSADEVARLTPLIDSPDYQAVRREAQYYRAFWLMKNMGVDTNLTMLALLQAGWQVDDRPELRARYLAEFADETSRIVPRPDDINWLGMEGRAIDALRELGRFDEAAARLSHVPLDALKPSGGAGEEGADARRAQLKRTWLTYFDQLKAAIERRDASLEPMEMIPRQVAIGYCIDRLDSLDGGQKAFCAREKKAVDEMRTALGQTQVDLSPISRPRSESGR